MEKILQLFRAKDLRDKLLYIAALLTVFRIASAIPVPGVDIARLKRFFEDNQVFGLFNLFSGGALSNFSLVMLGVGPYITASIIMQLLTMIFPKLKEMYQEGGEMGRQKFNQYSRLLTVPLAVLQAYGTITLLQNQQVVVPLQPLTLVTTICTIAAGSLLLMWLGELISEKGMGNGVSLIIFAGIVAGIPSSIQQTLLSGNAGSNIPLYVVLAVVTVVVIAAVAFITEAERLIPVTYAKRVRGMKMFGGASTYLPLRINQAGVIPIIFALSIMLFPGMIASFFSQSSVPWIASVAHFMAGLFTDQKIYGIVYFLLIILFTYFYTAVTFEPHQIAENVQKQGGFIPGIRPGKPTADYFAYIINRVTLAGAVFLGIIAILPFILQAATGLSALTIGGTAVLIVVSVVLESMKAVKAQLTMRQYESF
ncbi:MAG: preprotein translocase subunit SecY [bacterium]|nr:preprotein translocase subunit SecY [bacterium]